MNKSALHEFSKIRRRDYNLKLIYKLYEILYKKNYFREWFLYNTMQNKEYAKLVMRIATLVIRLLLCTIQQEKKPLF